MSSLFDDAISQRYSVMESGSSDFDLSVDADGTTVYAPKEVTPAEAMMDDQLNPFAIADAPSAEDQVDVGEFLQRTGQVLGGAAAGTLATAAGAPGDIAGIIKGLTDMVGAEEGERFATFLQGLSDVSGVIGSERTIDLLQEGVNNLNVSDEVKQDILAGSQFLGEFAGLPVTGGGVASTATKAAKKAKPKRTETVEPESKGSNE